MALDISIPAEQPLTLLTPKITVIGVGGAGGNAINNMIQSNLTGIDFAAANTDAQALATSLAPRKIQLGLETTKGQGAGARPEVGKEAAEEAADKIAEVLDGANMVFITAGMGGGTGTGAAPVVAKMARERDILTVGVVTKPFTFEGRHRMQTAERGIEELAQYVDTLIVIPNQNLFIVADESMTFSEAFKRADQVLQGGVRSITDLIIKPGIINLDFSDVRAVMSEMGRAMMGTGIASGDSRALKAAEEAINNPLLDDASMAGAKGILINIAGGADLTLFEVDEAANRIRNEVDTEANIIFGASFDDTLEGSIRVSVVATGITRAADVQLPYINKPVMTAPKPKPQPSMPVFTPAPAQTAAPAPAPAPEPASVPAPAEDETEEYEIEEEEPAPQVPASPAPMPAAPIKELREPKTTSSILPAMPSPSELFGTGEPKQPQADAFAPKLPEMTLPPSRLQPPSFMRVGQPMTAPSPAPRLQTEDLFVPPAPPVSVIPTPVKPVEKEKPRPSLFHFVTRHKPAEDTVGEQEAESDTDFPSFLGR